jgi:uncharacterized membrane protein
MYVYLYAEPRDAAPHGNAQEQPRIHAGDASKGIHTHKHTHTHTCASMHYIFIRIYMCIMYACMYVCVLYAQMHISTQTRAHTQTRGVSIITTFVCISSICVRIYVYRFI